MRSREGSREGGDRVDGSSRLRAPPRRLLMMATDSKKARETPASCELMLNRQDCTARRIAQAAPRPAGAQKADSRLARAGIILDGELADAVSRKCVMASRQPEGSQPPRTSQLLSRGKSSAIGLSLNDSSVDLLDRTHSVTPRMNRPLSTLERVLHAVHVDKRHVQLERASSRGWPERVSVIRVLLLEGLAGRQRGHSSRRKSRARRSVQN